jgi:hypothetical protein
MLLPHLPHLHTDGLLASAARHTWPPPFQQVPVSGLLLLTVEFPHFEHLQVPIKVSF